MSFAPTKEAVRIFTAIAVVAQIVGYTATELADAAPGAQITVVALLGIISAAARKFVYSEETVDNFAQAAGLRAAALGEDECGC